MGGKRLVNNYLEEARRSTPPWLQNKVFKCIYCGYQPIYLNNDFCPFGKENQKQENTFSSITIGIAILRKLELLHNDEPVDSKNEDLKRELFGSIQETCKALPLKDSEYILSKKEDLIDFYCSQHNYELKPTSQQIKKISVRKLFGYNSYDLDFSNDLSIIYGSNALGKTTIFKLFEYIFVSPRVNRDLNWDSASEKTPFEKAKGLIDDYRENVLVLEEVGQRIQWLFKIPFESFETTFSNGIQIKVSKHKDESGEESLHFDCPSRGFDSIEQSISISNADIDKKANGMAQAVSQMLRHYENVRQLFPGFNNVSKFLAIQADRNNNVLSLIESLPKETRDNIFRRIKPALSAKSDVDNLVLYFKYFSELQEYLFSLAFFSEVNDILSPLKMYFGRCNYYSKERVVFRWSQIANYFDQHVNSEFYKFLDGRTDEILDSPECVTYPESNESFKKNIQEVVSQFFVPGQKNGEGIKKTLDYLFDSPVFSENYLYLKSEINDMFDFYQKFKLFKGLFESLYFENDPGRKRLCINQGDKLIIKANTGLNFDYQSELSPQDLSTGEMNILILLYRLIYETTCDSIVLIDEPEISLHVEWQEQISYIIEKIMNKKPGMQIIIASHSPFIGAGKDPECFVSAKLIKTKERADHE